LIKSPRLYRPLPNLQQNQIRVAGINRAIKGLKGQAYGYKNMAYFALKIMQKCGYLNHRYFFTKLAVD
jgi:hypothetical protein